jgi:hypothetical protein
MTIYAVAVNYVELWKIRADVGICEGFNIQEFDKIIQVNSSFHRWINACKTYLIEIMTFSEYTFYSNL